MSVRNLIMAAAAAVPTAFRYWRIFMLNNNGDANYLCVAEVELRTSPGGTDLAVPTTPVTASSFYNVSGTTYPPSNVVNGGLNLSDAWLSTQGQTTSQWLLFDLSTPLAIKEVVIWADTTNPSRSPKDVRIEGSSDGVNFTVVGTSSSAYTAKRTISL